MKSSRLRAHLKAAEAYAELSKAQRLKVGAVLVREDRVTSIGYNGTPSGSELTCETRDDAGNLTTRREVLHAESNCIAFAARNGIATEGCTLVTTHSPCFECCKLLVQAGIVAVYYRELYRDQSGLNFLTTNGILTGQLQ